MAELSLTVVSGGDVSARLKEIPPHIINRWSRVTVWAVHRFFAMPGVREDYEKWLVEYRKKQAERKVITDCLADNTACCNDEKGDI